MFKGVNWAGVIAALIFGQALSYVWYNMVFGAAERAMYPAAATGNPGLTYGGGALLSLVLIVGLGWIVQGLGARGWLSGLKVGVLFWLFFMLTTELMRPLYMGTPIQQTEIDLGYELIFLAVSGALLGGLQLGRSAAAAS